MSHLRNLIYWNPDRMEELFTQIPQGRRPRMGLDEAAVKVTAGVLSASGRFRSTAGPASNTWTFLLDAVVDELRDRGQLTALRPATIDEYREDATIRYVYEFTSATRVSLPLSSALRETQKGLPRQLMVWVSDPPPRLEPPRDQWDFYGAYLYLVEEGDAAPFEGERTLEALKQYQSGCSALHRLFELARTREELGPERAAIHGRDSGAHPLTKLGDEGAHSALPRDIEVLYQMRYLSDEQGAWKGTNRKLDLLAYPLAILV
jgi:hypothetical protein